MVQNSSRGAAAHGRFRIENKHEILEKAEKWCEFRTLEMHNDLDIFTEVTGCVVHS